MLSTIQWIKNNPSKCIAPLRCRDIRVHDEQIKITCCCNLDTSTAAKLDYDFIDNLVEQMNQGQLPNSCHKCARDEANNAQSERVKSLVEFTPQELDTVFSSNLTQFQVGTKFSNLCNLACRSCNPNDSSYWASVMGQPADKMNAVDISQDEEYWQSFTDMIRAKHKETDDFIVQPIGGETVIQDGFLKLIEFLIAEDLASTTTLRFATSLVTNMSDQFWELFLQFRRVVIIASIDSVGENYHCVRWPAKFSKVEKNLQTVLDFSKKHPGKIELCISPVFSLNNIFYINDILDWFDHWATHNHTPLWISVIYLYRPEYLMIEALAKEYQPALIDLLEQAVQHPMFARHTKTIVLKNYLETMLTSLKNQPNNTTNTFQEFLKFTAQYDKRTKTDSRQLNSKLFGLLTQHDLEQYQQYYDKFTG